MRTPSQARHPRVVRPRALLATLLAAAVLSACGGSSEAADPLPATARAILPDADAMRGASYDVESSYVGQDEYSLCDPYPQVCGVHIRGSATIVYDSSVRDYVSSSADSADTTGGTSDVAEVLSILVLVHASDSEAGRTFTDLRDALDSDPSFEPGDQTPLGDDYAGFTVFSEERSRGAASLMRNGAYVTLVQQVAWEPHVVPDSETLNLNTLMAHRSREAGAGHTPRTTLAEVRAADVPLFWRLRGLT